MVVGFGIITFRLHGCRSLKAKRKIIKAIIAQIRNHFNASVAEVASNDAHQKGEIGFTLVGNNTSEINSKMDKIINFTENMGLAEMINNEMEIMVV